MFGSMSNQRKDLSELQNKVSQEFYDLMGSLQGGYGFIVDRFLGGRDASLESFTAQMQNAIGAYSNMIDQTRSRLLDQYGEAFREYAIGRDASIGKMRETTLGQANRTRAANAFTGLGNTSLGDQRVEAIEREGDVQEAMIREQYSAGLSAILQQRAQSMLGLDMTATGTLAQMRAGLAEGTMAYARPALGTMASGLSQVADLGQNRIGMISGLEQQRISLKRSSNIGGALLGGLAGTLLPGVGSALGGAFGSAIGGIFGGGQQQSGWGGGTQWAHDDWGNFP